MAEGRSQSQLISEQKVLHIPDMSQVHVETTNQSNSHPHLLRVTELHCCSGKSRLSEKNIYCTWKNVHITDLKVCLYSWDMIQWPSCHKATILTTTSPCTPCNIPFIVIGLNRQKKCICHSDGWETSGVCVCVSKSFCAPACPSNPSLFI